MPVRSLNSSVIKWPGKKEVEGSLRRWSEGVRGEKPLIKLGYFGSYAKGSWGVGSDLDIIIVLEEIDEPFELRGAGFDCSSIPVSTDLLVYSREEWQKMKGEKGGFYRSLSDEIVWIQGD